MKNQANDSQLYSQSKPRVLLQIPFYLLEKSLEIGRSRRTVASLRGFDTERMAKSV